MDAGYLDTAKIIRADAVAMLVVYRKVADRRDQIICDAYRAGLTKREIHQHSGVSRPTINRILGKAA